MNHGDGALQGFISEILSFAGPRHAKPTLREAEQNLLAAARRDYSSALRKQFDRQQLREVLSELHTFLPTLNREVFRIKDPRRLRKIAAEMGVVLRATDFKGTNGRELRGFYVPDRQFLKRPLICVNTANHPVAVAATFWHEVGHHLTARLLWDDQNRPPNMSFASGYEDHLDDPREIAADIVMGMACYPKPAAERLFGARRNFQEADGDRLVSSVVPYVRSVTGFHFKNELSVLENLHYLANLIHLVKLRSALLFEYGI